MNLDFDLKADLLEFESHQQNFYELLGVDKDANALAIKEGYLKQKQIYDKNALALYSLSSDSDRECALNDIESAYATLKCDYLKQEYDRKTFKQDVESTKELTHEASQSDVKNRYLPNTEKEYYFDTLASKHTYGTGMQIKSFREWLGIELQEVQRVTRISPVVLEAIENESFHLLPNIVYVKSFLRSLLRYYGLQNSGKYEKIFMERLKNWKLTSNH